MSKRTILEFVSFAFEVSNCGNPRFVAVCTRTQRGTHDNCTFLIPKVPKRLILTIWGIRTQTSNYP